MEDRRCVEWQRKEDWAGIRAVSGTGALCAEAQADGVPCDRVGVACETCERALIARWQRGGWNAPVVASPRMYGG